MNHSTTGTFAYILCKYSRSYPTKRSVQHPQTQHAGSELASDWQHFTNPVIRLVLDVKSTKNNEIQSVRLRILWQLNADIDEPSNQADTVFEDLDLLSFSAISSSASVNNPIEGLPLKAVYRDSVVGIRYLHSRENNVTSVYRRFQISFQSHSEASNFIEIIKPVCPCKINPSSVHPSLIPQGLPNGHFPSERQAILPTQAIPLIPGRVSSYGVEQPSHSTSVAHKSSLQSTQISSPSGFLASSNSISPGVLNPGPSHPLDRVPDSVVHNISEIPTLRFGPTSAGCSLIVPGSSLPSLPSSENSVHVPEQLGLANKDTAASFLRNDLSCGLSTSSESIYSMPNSTLERVVGGIINEEGFVQLLERLSEMFAVRDFLNGP